jgi:hypothetical protein
MFASAMSPLMELLALTGVPQFGKARGVVDVPIQDGRIYIEKINGPFLFQDKATPAERCAGLKLALARGWLVIHENGTYVKITEAGADLFAEPFELTVDPRVGGVHRIAAIASWQMYCAQLSRVPGAAGLRTSDRFSMAEVAASRHQTYGTTGYPTQRRRQGCSQRRNVARS